MTRLALVYSDLTHGGAMDPDGILVLACALFCGAALLAIAVNIWRTINAQERADEQIRRMRGES